MTVLARKPRYRFGGGMVMSDADQLAREFRRGDELPAEIQDRLSKAEIEILTRGGMLLEIGAAPRPKPAPEPPRRLTPLQTFQTVEPRATLEDGHVIGVPGCQVTIAEKTPRDVDFKRLVEPSRAIQVLVHPAGDGWAATVDLGALCGLLAGRRLMR